MKCLLSLKRLNGARLTAPAPEANRRLVSFKLETSAGYRVAHAHCCFGGQDIATLWEPTLIRVGDNCLLFQGFEKVGDQGAVQEWLLEPYFAEVKV